MSKKAQQRYDAKRPKPLSVRLTARELLILDRLRLPDEGRSTALVRMAGLRGPTYPTGEIPQ